MDGFSDGICGARCNTLAWKSFIHRKRASSDGRDGVWGAFGLRGANPCATPNYTKRDGEAPGLCDGAQQLYHFLRSNYLHCIVTTEFLGKGTAAVTSPRRSAQVLAAPELVSTRFRCPSGFSKPA